MHDKDGVSAGAVFAEMAGYLQRTHQRSIVGQLEHLASRLGNFCQNNGYIVCKNPTTTAAIFDRMRAEGHCARSGEHRTRTVPSRGPGGRTAARLTAAWDADWWVRAAACAA